MTKPDELPTLPPYAFSAVREAFLGAFAEDEAYIRFAMAAMVDGKEKQNRFRGHSGLIWEHLSPAKRVTCFSSMLVDFLKRKSGADMLLLTDAYQGKIASGESPVFRVTLQTAQELLHAGHDFWNLYFFDGTFQWYAAWTDEIVGSSSETICYLYDSQSAE